jgi:hypothetical protein
VEEAETVEQALEGVSISWQLRVEFLVLYQVGLVECGKAGPDSARTFYGDFNAGLEERGGEFLKIEERYKV